MPPFDLKLLLYLSVIAEEGSFSRAAEKLRIAQPWLSRQIRKLEAQLGFAVLTRTTRSVSLTDKGARLFEAFKPAAQHLEAVFALAQSLRAEADPAVRLGVAPYALVVEARTDLCDQFLAAKPGSRLEVSIGRGQQLLDDLRRGAIDAACMLAPAGALAKDLSSLTLCNGGVDIVVPVNDPLAAKRTIHLEDIRTRRMAAFSRESSPEAFDLVFGPFSAAGIQIVEMSDYGFYRRLAERRLVTALPAWQPSPVGGVARRPYVGQHPSPCLQLVRRTVSSNRELERLWRQAEQQTAGTEVTK